MEKRIVTIICLILLTSCSNSKTVACSYILDDKELYIDIKANNDEIVSFDVKTNYIIPTSIINKYNNYDNLSKQLNENSYIEDNKIIEEYSFEINQKYSLNKTIEYLKDKRIYCNE